MCLYIYIYIVLYVSSHTHTTRTNAREDEQAVALLEEMQEHGVRPDASVYASLIKAVADSQLCVGPQAGA
jgi:pentatricopeptide repeat protein